MDARAPDPDPPRRASVAVTFDNFGEAADLELGRHPPGEPVGRHFTATTSLERLLALVGGRPVTYFVEASNALLYPDALRRMQAHGIEIGLHGWRHENWGQRSATERADVLRRSVDAMHALGIEPRGFRPPGGAMPEGAVRQLAEAGLDYCSPLGEPGADAVADGIAVLPFAWRHVDAYVLDPRLGALRTRHGDPEPAADLPTWRRGLDDAVERARRTRSHATLVFHPFLFLRDAGMLDALRALLARLDGLPDVDVLRCADAAAAARRAAGAPG
jgi:peptidoglycan/xylan/chitin deacetylase (PgdA/CDA1 family)